ncbi:hypothetical protein BJ138DRAFT_1137362 [Hygrophoropsis aurantiaca]|uniref:Uncharacterized protein n=1 Tax=Hygrophoropsis aurantiaca TaxID=72124 RepID=A0ACB8A4E1_9AGAM|nr:hypothetical protein BJ138DRAFT_1137362 [Hygrophoropsis aurantiaca]
MKFILAAAILSVAPAALAQQLTINTPKNAQCLAIYFTEPTQFTWVGGQEPYYLSLTPGGQSMAAPIKQFPTQQGTTYTWECDLQAGTTFNIALKDNTGATAYSSIVTIQAGSDTSCVNTAVQEGGSSSGSAAPSASVLRVHPPPVATLVDLDHPPLPPPPLVAKVELGACQSLPLLALLELWVLLAQLYSRCPFHSTL